MPSSSHCALARRKRTKRKEKLLYYNSVLLPKCVSLEMGEWATLSDLASGDLEMAELLMLGRAMYLWEQRKGLRLATVQGPLALSLLLYLLCVLLYTDVQTICPNQKSDQDSPQSLPAFSMVALWSFMTLLVPLHLAFLCPQPIADIVVSQEQQDTDALI